MEERKRQIYEADLSRKENHALTELELEARDRAQRLVERANALRMEQEDEIKKLNQVGSSCGHMLNRENICLKVNPSVIVAVLRISCMKVICVCVCSVPSADSGRSVSSHA